MPTTLWPTVEGLEVMLRRAADAAADAGRGRAVRVEALLDDAGAKAQGGVERSAPAELAADVPVAYHEQGV